MLINPEKLSLEQLSGYISFLKSFKSEKRISTYERVLHERTRYFTVVMENIDHPHNVSAVLRSCDCFGIQDVHLVDDSSLYSVNKKIAMGSSNWLSIKKYSHNKDNTKTALTELKNKGYRLVVTSPHKTSHSIHDFDISLGPAAFIFGTELTGISDTAKSFADEYISIPMVGFTESLNLSVSVAIILHSVTSRLRVSDLDWELSEKEKDHIMIDWLRKSTPKINILEKHFLKGSL